MTLHRGLSIGTTLGLICNLAGRPFKGCPVYVHCGIQEEVIQKTRRKIFIKTIDEMSSYFKSTCRLLLACQIMALLLQDLQYSSPSASQLYKFWAFVRFLDRQYKFSRLARNIQHIHSSDPEFKESRNRFPAWRNLFLGIDSWARICKHFMEPRNQFPTWRAGTTALFVVPVRKAT